MTVVVDTTPVRTLGDLKTRIGKELARTQQFGPGGSLEDLCQLAIDDAISEAAGNRFWFNETRSLTIALTAGTEYYGSDDVDQLVKLDSAWITVNGQRRNIRRASQEELDRLADGNSSTGEPYKYAFYGNRLRIYPVPQRDYTLTFDGVSSLPPLSDDDYANAWTNEGERYIRALAKRNLLNDVIDEPDSADRQHALAEKYKTDLLAQTSDRLSTGELRSWCG